MEEVNLLNWATLLLAPITGIASWYAARRKRNNEALDIMQETINKLVQENADLYALVVKLREENAELKNSISAVKFELESFKNMNLTD